MTIFNREACWGVVFRRAPIMVSVIDTEEQIRELFPRLDGVVQESVIATSPVEVIRYSRGPATTT